MPDAVRRAGQKRSTGAERSSSGAGQRAWCGPGRRPAGRAAAGLTELPAGLTDSLPAGLTARPGRRQPPPRHLADLDQAGRRAAASELGLRPFRADQLSRHYFGRLTDDPADMTDLPAAERAELAGALLPAC